MLETRFEGTSYSIIRDRFHVTPSTCFRLVPDMLDMWFNCAAFQIGGFETTSAGCVAVAYPANPDPPFVAISAPAAVGHCDDLAVEGSATVAFLGWRLMRETRQNKRNHSYSEMALLVVIIYSQWKHYCVPLCAM